MPTIYIDNKPYEVPEGLNLLHACLSLGFDIPYFCWHPAMHSVGACRQCAVKQFKDEHDTKGKIVMSCMTLAKDGTRISIDDPEVIKFRTSVIEWLMINHPHDCPVCDEGGECHLQDMTQMVGHVYRRYRFPKRSYRNQDLGPFVTHEMNRCIQCYRCVRFYIDYAGGRDLEVLGWHDRVYFGRHEDGVLQSKFSGNLVEVCPTGVFTDKTLARHYTRKWDLQTAPSVCVHCGLGCNTIPGERYGTLRRIRNRYNGDVNGYFLCDRGRYGYEFVNSRQKRIRQPLVRDAEGRLLPAQKDAVLSQIAGLINGSDLVIGLGSARASLESNFALRSLVGPESFYLGASDAEAQRLSSVVDILRNGPVRCASSSEVALADAVLVLGEDVSNVAPVLDLALKRSILRKPTTIIKELRIDPWNDTAVREAIQTDRGPLFIATTHETDLDAVATHAYHAAPQEIARLGFAVANKLDVNAPSVPDLPADVDSLAQRIVQDLSNAQRPLVVSGTSCGSKAVLEAAATVACALHSKNKNTRICFTVPWCNSMGLGLIGGKSIGSAIEAIGRGTRATVIVLENDVYRYLDAAQTDRLMYAADHVVAIDCLHNGTTAKAGFILPAATFAESTGTLVNNEGRAQRFFKVFNPADEVRESWRWIADIMAAAGRYSVPPWRTFDEIVADLAQKMPVFEPVAHLSPPAGFRIVGEPIARQPHRYSGRTAMYAHVTVHEPRRPDDPDSPLSFSMEGYEGQPPSSLIPRFWAPRWNSVQSLNKFQEEVAGPLRGGNPGERLIEPVERTLAHADHSSASPEEPHGLKGTPNAELRVEDPQPILHAEIPAAFERREGYLLVVPGYYIFGSEELSMLSPGVAELAAGLHVTVNPQDARQLRMDSKGLVEIALGGVSHHVPVRLDSAVPPGLAV
ncbi:MAG: NADH-quinone oxidoreductase subunit G, partial [Planctomycetes bacterium RBG_13_60_9]